MPAWWMKRNIYVEAISPLGSYAPSYVKCPKGNLVRVAEGLSEEETKYMEQRRKNEINTALVGFFERVKVPGFDYQTFFDSHNENRTIGVGMAVSGGGFRSMLIGAGGLSALDIRTPGSDQPGHLGGLLQGMSYLSGLSGGAWLIGSVYMSNMPTISDIVSQRSHWNLDVNPLIGSVVEKSVSDRFESVIFEIIGSLLEGEHSVAFKKEVSSYVKFKALALNSTMSSTILTKFDPYETPAAESSENPVVESKETPVAEIHETPARETPADVESVEMQRIKRKLILSMLPADNIRQYYESLYNEILPKKLAGFDISITDFWARALAKVFLREKYMPEMSWSDLMYAPMFQSFQMPYPIITANALVPKTIPDANTSTIIEMTPYETGSWSPTLGAFVKTRFIGTPMINGLVNGGADTCVTGFDNGAFLVATSSSLFNDLAAMGIKHLDAYPQLRTILGRYKTLMNLLRLDQANIKANMDYALFSPNPFLGFHEGVTLPSPAEINRGTVSLDDLVNMREHGNAYTNSKTLHLVDGGEDDLNVPLDPLLRPDRKMDLIIALDASIDKGPHPNVTALYRHTWRYHGKEHIHGIAFPNIPEPHEFLAKNYQEHPTFYGCDLDAYPSAHMFGGSSSLNQKRNTILPKPPLILYIPNKSISFNAQQATTRLVYGFDDINGMVTNGYNLFTQSNSTEWAACVGCAVIHREVIRRGDEFPEYCQKCFKTYCVT